MHNALETPAADRSGALNQLLPAGDNIGNGRTAALASDLRHKHVWMFLECDVVNSEDRTIDDPHKLYARSR